ncbi:MAG: hypothetical protein ACYTFK_12550 [Planctomycetota bacterium]
MSLMNAVFIIKQYIFTKCLRMLSQYYQDPLIDRSASTGMTWAERVRNAKEVVDVDCD